MSDQATRRTLLLVWHSRTGAARQMAQAAEHGATQAVQALDANATVQIIALDAEQCTASDVLAADAFLFCAPENLGSLSGAMKEFFDRTYYAALDQLNGKPAAILIAAGSDGQGAARQTERICTGWRLRLVAPTLIVNTQAQTREQILAAKHLTAPQLQPCADIGGTLAAMLT